MCFFLGLLNAGASEKIEVIYSPEVIYRSKPLTFRTRVPEEKKLLVQTNGVERVIPAVPSDQKEVELTLYPEKDGTVTFGTGPEADWTFKVVTPGYKGVFSERDGFLESGGVPIILMPDHLLPPDLDRRWETLALIREELFTTKPVIKGIHWYGPKSSELSGLNPSLTRTQVVTHVPEKAMWFRIHGLIASVSKDPASFVAVEVDLHDLERGVPLHIWVMKWQFFLQHLQENSGYKDGLLFGPDFADPQGEQAKLITEQLRSMAVSNGLRYIDRSLPREEWQKRLVYQLEKEYKLP